MNKQIWTQSPFFSNFGSLSKAHKSTSLPFSIGSISRQGHGHLQNGINNQDAQNLIIDDKWIIGVICDGCTSNHPGGFNKFSANHIGASLHAELISRLCYSFIKKSKVIAEPDSFMEWLSDRYRPRLAKIITTLGVRKASLEEFVCNYLLATVIGFVITPNNYCIFHWGDGFTIINDQLTPLSSDSGKYSALSILENNSTQKFKPIAHGNTSELERIIIATDGMGESDFISKEILPGFYVSKKSGPIDITPQLHTSVLNDFYRGNNGKWPTDDASMIVLQRVSENDKDLSE